jgi:hypothetical protein
MRPRPKQSASRTRWDRVPRRTRLLHQRLGSPARASRFLLGAQGVAGSARLNLLWDPRVHPVLMASVPHWTSASSEHRTGVARGLAAAISGHAGSVAVLSSVRFGRDAVLLRLSA